MSVQIQKHVKAAPVRKPNEYDPTIEALAEFEDGTQEAVLTQPPADIAKHIRRFRNAAKAAEYRSREVRRTENEDGTVSVALTISKKKSLSGVVGDVEDDDTAE